MAHTWRFFRAGGFDQVRLESGDDLKALAELDPKLWVALACPVKGNELNAHTLELLDTDHDGRIRVPEVLAAVKWACSVLKNPDELLKGQASLPLAAINDATDEGRRILGAARQVLTSLGNPTATSIAPEDTTDSVKIFSKTVFNGDGVIPPESAGDDEATAAAIKDVIACLGPEKDMSGLDGVSQARVDALFKEAATFVEWWKSSEGNDAVLPLKDGTLAAWDAIESVRSKVDDFFARCGVAAMDARAVSGLNPAEAEYVAFAASELSGHHAKLAALPLARIEGNRALPLTDGLNPAWADKIARLRDAAIKPLIGDRDALTRADWVALTGRLAAHAAWQGTKPAVSVEKLGVPRLKALVASGAKAAIEALLAKDKAVEPEMKAITSVDRLAHYFRDLRRFLDNFVAFKDFYTKKDKAIFQAGRLFLDGRSLDLCMRVDDPGKHAALANLSMTYLAYVDCTRKGSAEKMTIAAAFTGGDSDFLMVGRNGVFWDRAGNDWDATITRLVEQPISIRQAFWAPYKRVAKLISSQVEKFAASKDKASSEGFEGAVGSAGKLVEKPKDAAPAAFDVAKFAGIFAAIGLALGAVASAAVALASGFMSLKLWQMPLALAGAMLLISTPSMLLAALKLRQRNLGPLLDASGWAINARARLNIPFGGSLTHLAALPPGSELSRTDPFAEKKQPWMLYLVLAAIAGAAYWAFREGYVQAVLDKLMAP